MLAFICNQHPCMPQHHFYHLFHRRFWQFFSGFHIMNDISENPGIALGSSCNHKSVASGVFFHTFDIFPCNQIAVADHRDLYRLFHLPDNVPVCFSGIELFSGSSVNCDGRRTRFLGNAGQFHCIDMGIIKPFPDFDGDRFSYCPSRFFNNLCRKEGIFHQGRTVAVVNDFGNGASHINIQNVKGQFFYLLCDLTDDLCI